MNNTSTVQRIADPYFHDMIEPDSESAGIGAGNFTGHRIRQLPLMRENFTV